MRNIVLIIGFSVISGSFCTAGELHKIAREGTIFDMNVKLETETDILVRLDEVDENGLTVWQNAQLNPNAVEMVNLLEAFREEQELEALDRGYQMLDQQNDEDEAAETQFLTDEDVRAQELYDHFWGIGREDAADRENMAPNVRQEGAPLPLQMDSLSSSFSPPSLGRF